MKKEKLIALALLGVTQGVMLNATVVASISESSELEGQDFLSHQSTHLQALAAGCGAKCSSIASGCGAKCSSIASGCGAKCSTVAERDVSGKKLENPATVAPATKFNPKDDYNDPNSENLGYHLMTEKELLLELNDAGTKQYQSLSPEGKALAIEVASQRCARTNSCRGLNACATDSNKCAGQGSCRGKTKCGFSDKNLAVKIAAQKMQAKRSDLIEKK